MCDSSTIKNWLILTTVAIFLAAAIITGAAIANGSWWYTYLSPIGMLVAAGITGSAIGFVNAANGALNVFCECAGKKCMGACTNLHNLIIAANTVLGIQLTACLAVAAYAWIPTAAQPAQWTIIGALTIEAALIISGFVFINNLKDCQT
jgi:hypothetical protein